MKLSREAMARDQLTLVSIKLPKSMLEAIDRAASKNDCAVPNRSQVVREILFRSLSREAV